MIHNEAGTSEFRTVVLVQHARKELQTLNSLRLSKNNSLRSVETVLGIAGIATDLFQHRKGQTIGLEKAVSSVEAFFYT